MVERYDNVVALAAVTSRLLKETLSLEGMYCGTFGTIMTLYNASS